MKQPSNTNQPDSSATNGEVLYVECRECTHCGHVGINDSSDKLAACHNCDWSGPTPIEDHCPGCADSNCIGAACPKCGAIYKLLAEGNLPTPAPQAATPSPGGRVDERALFEALVRKECGMTDASLAKSADGRYEWARTADMFWAWKARAALNRKPPC